MTMAQDLTDANVSTMAAENLPAPTILLSEVATPDELADELADDNNVNNYNGIN